MARTEQLSAYLIVCIKSKKMKGPVLYFCQCLLGDLANVNAYR
jgi:hypothetical protein